MKMKRLICFALSFIFLLQMSLAVPASEPSPEVLKVGFFAFSGYHITEEDGRRSGYGYEFLQKMAAYENWTYEYLGYNDSYADALEMLRNGEVDIVTSVSKTAEREKEFLFSDQNIGFNSTILTVKAGNHDIVEGDYTTYDGITVGMLEANSKNTNFERFAAEHGFTFTPVYFEEQEELSDALQKGELDAVVTGSLRVLENEWLLESFDASPFYICVRKDRPDLMERINKAIGQMDLNEPNWRNTLHDEYYTTDHDETIVMNAAERDFLNALQASDKPLRLLFNPERVPYAYFEDGKARGILPAVFEALAERLSLKYEFIPVKDQEQYMS